MEQLLIGSLLLAASSTFGTNIPPQSIDVTVTPMSSTTQSQVKHSSSSRFTITKVKSDSSNENLSGVNPTYSQITSPPQQPSEEDLIDLNPLPKTSNEEDLIDLNPSTPPTPPMPQKQQLEEDLITFED